MGVFAEVIANDFRDVGVDGFVVGDSGADGVGEGYVARAICVEEAGDAEDGIAAETERIEEIVVNAAIDDIDAAQAGGGAHVDDVVVDEKVAAFDQFDAHLLGEKCVFEIGGVGDAGSEEDGCRILRIWRIFRARDFAAWRAALAGSGRWARRRSPETSKGRRA